MASETIGEGLVHSDAVGVSVPTEIEAGAAASDCRVCDATGWVCENCNDRPWEGMSSREDACHCGAGSPCWICNREMALAGPLHEARDHIKALLAELDHGWGCACSFPSEHCCAYSRAEAYLAAGSAPKLAGYEAVGRMNQSDEQTQQQEER